MMREEFEKMTGIYPTADMYEAIEEAYMESNGEKQEFCKAYKANKNGMAEAIQRKHDMTKALASIREKTDSEKRIADMTAQIARLEAKLESEQEWKPYESANNVKQSDYQRLADSVSGGAARYMTDEEAIDWVVLETGFSRSLITIIHEVDTEEINRHNCLRINGKVDRRPIYCATDYHYIRFNVRANVTNCYELWNDLLRPFWN